MTHTVNAPKDTVYSQPQTQIKEFVFDNNVAAVFSDMIQRSVPGYATTISTIGELAMRFAQPNSRCYDLGCSLGAATLAMRHAITAPGCEIIAVDNSSAMTRRCEQTLAADSALTPVTVLCDDIQNIHIENASLVVLNFTLQFIPIAERHALLAKIHAGLLPNGKLILSEKIDFPDPYLNDLNINLHHQFKKAHGYSALEISQKRSALENTLIPETIQKHKDRLHATGFSRADVWYQCFNFMSMVAVR